MALTNQERVDVRRFCGYGMYGNANNLAGGYRYFTQYGVLEFRMTNLAAEEETTLRLVYLTGNPTSLYALEAAVYGSTANLDTDKASVWTHNKNEVRDRRNLFNQMRRDLCGFLGIEPGPDLGDGSASLIV